MSDDEKPKPILSEEEAALFGGWAGDPVGTLARHSLGAAPADLLAGGKVLIPVPPFLMQHGLPRRIMTTDTKLLRSVVGLPTDFRYIKHGSLKNNQVLVFWLDEQALGRHAGKPMTRELEHKLQDRLQDMIGALTTRHGFTPQELEGRICLLKDGLRTLTGHRVCGAVLLATTTEKAPLLTHEVKESLEGARAVGTLVSHITPQGILTGKLRPAPFIAATPPAKDIPVPPRLQRELAEQHETVAKVAIDPALKDMLCRIPTPFTYAALHEDKKIVLHAYYADGTAGGRIPADFQEGERSKRKHSITHILYCQLHDQQFETYRKCGRELPLNSPEQAEMFESARKRYEPMVEYLRHKYSTDIYCNPIFINGENVPPLLVFIMDSDKQHLLERAAQDFTRLREQAQQEHAARQPQETQIQLQPEEISDTLVEQMKKSFGPCDLQEINYKDYINLQMMGADKQPQTSSPLHISPQKLQAQHRITHVVTLWLDDPALRRYQAYLQRGGKASENASRRLAHLLEPVTQWLHEQTGQPVRFYPQLTGEENGPVLLVMGLDMPGNQRKALLDLQPRLSALRNACQSGKWEEFSRLSSPLALLPAPPSAPEPTPSPPPRKKFPTGLRQDGVDEIPPQPFITLMKDLVGSAEVPAVKPGGAVDVAIPGSAQQREITLPDSMLKATHPPRHVATLWLANDKLAQLQERANAAIGEHKLAADSKLQDMVAPAAHYLGKQSSLATHCHVQRFDADGPTLLILSVDAPDQEILLQRFAEKVQEAAVIGNRRRILRPRDDDNNTEKGR